MMAYGIHGRRSSIQLTINAARIAILVVLVCAVDTPFVGAQEPVAAARQTFRTRTELVRLEVSVLDKERNPVRGLQSSDFRIEIDGVTRPVVFAEEVNVTGPQDDRGALPAKLDATYAAIRSRAPSARVVVLGYPRLISPTCCTRRSRARPSS